MSIQVDYTELSKNFNLFNEELKKMLSINNIFFFDMLPIIGNKIEDYYILKKRVHWSRSSFKRFRIYFYFKKSG
tara:strand:- start:137 stop:358 length:222 start_codon:yes stop_codon:yes gene_type:complete